MQRKGNDLGAVFRLYRTRLLSFIRSRGAGADAEDILQDIFLRLIRTEETVSVMQVSGWLYKVARNMIIDRKRKRREEPVPEYFDKDVFIDEITSVLTENGFENEDLRSMVWAELEEALSELPEPQRMVFVETALHNVSFNELSERTGTSVKTLLSRKHYAVKYLRERMYEIYEILLTD